MRRRSGTCQGPRGLSPEPRAYYARRAGVIQPLARSLRDGLPAQVVDAAQGPNGELYAAPRHVYPGNFRDIAFTSSRDGGRSFSSPVRVSEDGWAINGCPDDGPAMAVDASGTVYLVWPTVIGDATQEIAIFYRGGVDRSRQPRRRSCAGAGPALSRHGSRRLVHPSRVRVWVETPPEA
jgi:hypothetical protein